MKAETCRKLLIENNSFIPKYYVFFVQINNVQLAQ